MPFALLKRGKRVGSRPGAASNSGAYFGDEPPVLKPQRVEVHGEFIAAGEKPAQEVPELLEREPPPRHGLTPRIRDGISDVSADPLDSTPYERLMNEPGPGHAERRCQPHPQHREHTIESREALVHVLDE